MIRSGEADRDVTLEMTPLIDMVFLLLIFFLVATTFHQTEDFQGTGGPRPPSPVYKATGAP